MLNKLFEWMEREYASSRRSLSIFRIVFATSLLLYVAPLGLNLVGLHSDNFHPPIGLPRVFPALPGAGWVVGINAVIGVLAALLLVGFRTRAVSLLLGVAILLACAAQYSTGKIHHTILVPVTAMLMALTDWGGCYSLDARRHAALPRHEQDRRRAWSGRALALIALATGLAFFTGGLAKAQTGWLATDTSATLGHAFGGMRGSVRDPLLFEPLRRWLPALLWEAMDWSVVLFELGMVCLIPWRRAFRWVLAFAVSFHLGVMLLYEIWFLTLLPTYAGFVAWGVLMPRRADLPGFRRRWDRRRAAVGFALALLLVAAAALVWPLAQSNLIDILPLPVKITVVFLPPVLVALGWVVYDTCNLLAPRPKTDPPTLNPERADTHDGGGVLLFDGVCGLCNAWVDFVMKRDRAGAIRYAPLQGEFARSAIDGLDPGRPPESLLLIDEDGLHLYSSAALKTLARLPSPWRWSGVLLGVPYPLRDGVYRVIARHRYRFTKQKDTCRLPTPEERGRFVM